MVDWRTRITTDPNILVGKPVVRGSRISVEHVLRALAAGVPEDEFLADFPDLGSEDLRACQAYAAEIISGGQASPVRVGA